MVCADRHQASTWSLAVALACVVCACGARSGLDTNSRADRFDASADVQAFRVACSAPQVVDLGAAITPTARATGSAGSRVDWTWTVVQRPAGSSATLAPANTADTGIQPDRVGDWQFRAEARTERGETAACLVEGYVRSAIDLTCPNDVSDVVGARAMLTASARSRSGRAVALRWSVTSRPAGSRTDLAPTAGTTSALDLDVVGDWRVRVDASDDTGARASCEARVHADPDLVVTCPTELTGLPGTTVEIAASARSRRGRRLALRWDVRERPVFTSTTPTPPDTARTTLFLDGTGVWSLELTAMTPDGDSASCTTRARTSDTSAVRIETYWNVDRTCTCCGENGLGARLEALLSDYAQTGDGFAPRTGLCSTEGCLCEAERGVCPNGMLEWPPAGIANNPQINYDATIGRPGPINTRVLVATPGARFNVGVGYAAYYSPPCREAPPTPALVRVYCRGALIYASERVTLTLLPRITDPYNTWRVGQVRVLDDGCVFDRCGAPGDTAACVRPLTAF